MSADDSNIDARLKERVHREVDRRFYGTWSGAVGTAAASLIIAVTMWPYASHERLVIWTAFSCLTSVALYLANTLPSWRRERTEQGLAKVAAGCSTLSGLAFGSVAWLDGSILDDPIARTTLCAVYLALTAGTIGGLAGIGGIPPVAPDLSFAPAAPAMVAKRRLTDATVSGSDAMARNCSCHRSR